MSGVFANPSLDDEPRAALIEERRRGELAVERRARDGARCRARSCNWPSKLVDDPSFTSAGAEIVKAVTDAQLTATKNDDEATVGDDANADATLRGDTFSSFRKKMGADAAECLACGTNDRRSREADVECAAFFARMGGAEVALDPQK